MQITTTTNLAQQIIARYTAFLSIAAPDADIVFLQQPVQEQASGGTVFNEQSIQHINNCIVQNTLISVNVSLQFLNNMIQRAVQQINGEDRRAAAMTAHTIVLSTMQKERVVTLDTKATQIATSTQNNLYKQMYKGDTNNMQTLSKTVLQSTMAQLVNNVTGSANLEYLNALDLSANISNASREMQPQERGLSGKQKETAAKAQQSSANTLPNMPTLQHHNVKDNSLTQKNEATVHEPPNISLIHGETAANKRIYYKRASAAKKAIENFETTMQKAEKALGIINKTMGITAQTDNILAKSQSGNKSVKPAQPITNAAETQGETNLQKPAKAQKTVMRKEQINQQIQPLQNLPQTQTLHNLPQTQTLQNSPQTQTLQNLPQTQTLQNSPQTLHNLPQTQTLQNLPQTMQKLSQTITAQNQNPINQNSTAPNTALMNRLFTYADFLRNTAQKPVLSKPQTMEMRKEQSPPQAQNMQNKSMAQNSNIAQNKSMAQNSNIAQNKSMAQNSDIAQNKSMAQNSDIAQNKSMAQNSNIAQNKSVAQNSNTAQNKSMAQNGNIAQNKSMAQNSNIAPNNIVAQNEALASQLFTSAEVLHNKAQKQIQEKAERADKSALPIVQNAKQSEPFTTVNTAASQLIYPMANMQEPVSAATMAPKTPLGIFANNAMPISRYLPYLGESFMQNAAMVRQSEVPFMQHKALARRQTGKAKAEARANALVNAQANALVNTQANTLANAQQALPLEYSLSPIYGEPQAKSHLPQDLSKVYSRSEAPIARVFPKEKTNAPQGNTPQDDAMDIPTVHKKAAETYKTTTDIQKQNIEINSSQPIQSVKSEDTTMELQEAEVMRITDKVYHAIESRLRSEKMRRGMW